MALDEAAAAARPRRRAGRRGRRCATAWSIAARHNERELTGDPTAHAEVLALRDAAAASGTGGSTTARSWSRSSRA